METEQYSPNPPARKRRRYGIGLRAAVIGAAVLSVPGIAAANVLVENFMAADFTGANAACVTKTAGEDVTSFPDGFGFSTDGTTVVDNVNVMTEQVTITGVTGDRVTADEVYVIENNCTTDLTVQIARGETAGDWTGKHMEVWLGQTTNTGSYPATGDDTWDQTPIVFDPTGVTTAGTGSVTIPAGESVPVGMIVTTGVDAAGTGTANWVVRAESS